MQGQPIYVLNQRGVGYYVSSFGRFPARARDVQTYQPAPPLQEEVQEADLSAEPALLVSRAGNGR
jgi:hypothetical protein